MINLNKYKIYNYIYKPILSYIRNFKVIRNNYSSIPSVCYNNHISKVALYTIKKPRIYGLISLLGITVKKEKPIETNKDLNNSITLSIKKSILAKLKGNYKDSEDHCHNALDILAKHYELFDRTQYLQSRTYILDTLANLAVTTGDYKTAVVLFKDTLKLLFQQKIEEHANSVVEISLKIAMILASQDQNQEAEKGFLFCLKKLHFKLRNDENNIESELAEDTRALLARCYDAYSRYLVGIRAYTEAKQFLEESISIAVEIFESEHHEQISTLYSDLANVLNCKGEHEEALKAIEKSVQIAESIQSDNINVFYCNYGNILLNNKMYEQASKYCMSSLRMSKKDLTTKKQANECLKDIKKAKKNDK